MIKIAGMTRSAGMHSDQIPNSSPSLPPAKNPYVPPSGDKQLTEDLLGEEPLVLSVEKQPTIFGPKVLTPNIEELRKRFQGDSQ